MLCTPKLSYSSVSIRNAPAAQDYLTHPSQEFLRFQSFAGALKPRQLFGDDLAEIALRQFEFDSAKVLIEAMQSSLVVLGIGTIHGFCASSEADATLS
jgi:hypothetical protein